MLTSLQAGQLTVLCLGLGTPQSLWLFKPLLFSFSLLNGYSAILRPLAELGTFHLKWMQWRTEQAMFKSLVMPSENAGIDFLNKTLNGKRPIKFKLNPLIGNQLIITDKIFAQYHFIVFKKSIHKKSAKPKNKQPCENGYAKCFSDTFNISLIIFFIIVSEWKCAT